jgi:S-formylglutathione hydrolase FrmB
MGGYGALKIAMKHPELFGSVSSHSAALVPDFNSTTVTGRRLDQFK